MPPEKKPRRSSILKPPKLRNPLSELDLRQNVDDDGTTFDRNKRVSFSTTQGIALFRMADHGNTIWDEFFEETNKNITCSTDGSQLPRGSVASMDSLYEQNDAQEQHDKFEQLKKQVFNDDSFDMSFTPENAHNVTFAANPAAENDNDDDNEDHCIIGVAANQPTDKRLSDILLELTNPSMTDQTEALINYKIPTKNISNTMEITTGYNKECEIESDKKYCEDRSANSEMSITLDISKPIQEIVVPKTKPKSTFVHSCVNIIADIKDKGKCWIDEKENIQLIPNVNDISDIENQLINKNNIPKVTVIPDLVTMQSNDTENPDRKYDLRQKILDYNMLNPLFPMALPEQNDDHNHTNEIESLLSMINPINVEKPQNMSTTVSNHKRRTVVFDPQSDECEMSMTMAVPSVSNKCNIKKKMDVFESESLCDMSITKAIKTQNNSDLYDYELTLAAVPIIQFQKEKVIDQFDPQSDDCEMSMTMAVSSISDLNNKRKTVVLSPQSIYDRSLMAAINTQVDNDLTLAAVPIIQHQKTIIEDTATAVSQECEQQTDNPQPNDCEMSMTIALPSISNNLDNRRKTIVFVPQSKCDISIKTQGDHDLTLPPVPTIQNQNTIIESNILPLVSSQENERGIIQPQHNDCEMSMTMAISSISNNIFKDKTTVFDVEGKDYYDSTLATVPIIQYQKTIIEDTESNNQENNILTTDSDDKRKTIVFDSQCNDMSMTVTNEQEIKIIDHKSTAGELILETNKSTIDFSSQCHEMSITVAIPSGAYDEKIDVIANKSVLPQTEDNQQSIRKTIVFNSQCNEIPTTFNNLSAADENNITANKSTVGEIIDSALPQIGDNQQIKMSRIVFDSQCNEMSMTVDNLSVANVKESEMIANKSNIGEKMDSTLTQTVDYQQNIKRTTVFDSQCIEMSVTNEQENIIIANKSTVREIIDSALSQTVDVQQDTKKSILFNLESNEVSMTVDNMSLANDLNLKNKIITKSAAGKIFDLIHPLNEDNQQKLQKTIVLDLESNEMSMTIDNMSVTTNDQKNKIIANKSNVEKIFDSVHPQTEDNQQCKRRTIVIDSQYNEMSMTVDNMSVANDLENKIISNKSTVAEIMDSALPQTVDNQQNLKRTIVVDLESNEMSMTVDNMSVANDKKNVIVANKSTVEVMDFALSKTVDDQQNVKRATVKETMELSLRKTEDNQQSGRKTIVLNSQCSEIAVTANNLSIANDNDGKIIENKSTVVDIFDSVVPQIEDKQNKKTINFDSQYNAMSMSVDNISVANDKESEIIANKSNAREIFDSVLLQTEGNQQKKRRTIGFDSQYNEILVTIDSSVATAQENNISQSKPFELSKGPIESEKSIENILDEKNENSVIAVIKPEHKIETIDVAPEAELKLILLNDVEKSIFAPKFDKCSTPIPDSSMFDLEHKIDNELHTTKIVVNNVSINHKLSTAMSDKPKSVECAKYIDEKREEIIIYESEEVANSSIRNDDKDKIKIKSVSGEEFMNQSNFMECEIIDNNERDPKVDELETPKISQEVQEILEVSESKEEIKYIDASNKVIMLDDAIQIVKEIHKSTTEYCVEDQHMSIVEDVSLNLKHDISDRLQDKEMCIETEPMDVDFENQVDKEVIIKVEQFEIITEKETNENGINKTDDEEVKQSLICEENTKIQPDTSIDLREDLLIPKMEPEDSVVLETSEKRKFSSSDLYDNDDSNNKRQRTSLEACSWIKNVRNLPIEDLSLRMAATIHDLDNFSDISLVNTSAEDNAKELDISEKSKNEDDVKFNNSFEGEECLQSEDCSRNELSSMIEDPIINIDEFKALKFNTMDCCTEDLSAYEWNFLLLKKTIRLKIKFESRNDNIIRCATNVASISIDICMKDSKSKYMHIAMMNQLNLTNLNSLCSTAKDVPNLLNYCAKTSSDVRNWEGMLQFLHLVYGFESQNDLFTFKITSGSLGCIWRVNIRMCNLPYASVQDITIKVIAGSSHITQDDFVTAIKEIEPDFYYMKNLSDNLHKLVKKFTTS